MEETVRGLRPREHAVAEALFQGLVAAAALSIGGRLATGNPNDFPFRELSVEHRRVGA